MARPKAQGPPKDQVPKPKDWRAWCYYPLI